MLKIIQFIFGTFIAVIGILLIVSTFPVTGNFKVLVVRSGSMEPEIKTGGIVLVKPVAEYNVGDVITFFDVKSPRFNVTHRIVEIKDGGGQKVYVTKGDANKTQDPEEILSRNVIGKVLFDVPYIGYAVNAAKTKYGFIALIILPALIIIFDEFKKITNEISKIQKKRKEIAEPDQRENAGAGTKGV